MHFIELLLLAVGLSMDAFAVAICAGLTMDKATFKKSLAVGLHFGLFQAVMPITGYAAAMQFADRIIAYGHWIAFALLCILGGKMMIESFQKDACPRPMQLLPLALATSIDALAVGVSFAFLRVAIVPAALFIGMITFVLSVIGVKIGSVFGAKFKSKAEFAGGAMLALIGLKILLEHLGVLH